MLSFPNWTFLFQIVLFLCLWAFLRRFLFEPNFAVLTEREERSAGALKEASRIKAEAEAMSEQYRSRLTEARAGALQQVDAIYRDADAQAQALIESARTEAMMTLSQLRSALQQETAEARRALETRTPEFSRDIAQKLLGRSLT
ncbi:MAG TPA: ATP synthase F0 subunit B [Methylomirabilota bacterium]|nr:ATP synthase F0 subunit B [Methylomirabilota bacterium]